MDKESIRGYLIALRDSYRAAFEKMEGGALFQVKPWPHHSGGGGEISLLEGNVFEKAAVNFSEVWGSSLPLGPQKESFFATGVSLITHMKNPHAPTAHFNIRYIETPSRFWVGGGFDLTPMGFPYEEDTRHFHAIAKKATGPLYPQLAENAKKYFFIPHRNKERGVGGIFFDEWNTGDPSSDFTLWKSVGDHFLEALLPIVERRIDTPYQEEEIRLQEKMRAHYVEFNLLYDKGTKFGFTSGGNPEAILCSMPPRASWLS